MARILRWAGLLTGIALILFCISDMVQSTQFLHSHGLNWSWAMLKADPMLPGRWAMWLFVAVVLLGNVWYAHRKSN